MELNPTGLAILPSELDQKKKEDGMGDIVMPWDVKQGGKDGKTTTTTTTTTKPSSMVTVVDENGEEIKESTDGNNDMEDGEDEEEEMGEDGQPKKKRQRKNQTTTTPDQTDSLEPLLGSITTAQDDENLMVENESMQLGSHLFNEEDQIISAAEAVKILHSLGYEAVGDISAANPYHTVDEIENEMKDE